MAKIKITPEAIERLAKDAVRKSRTVFAFDCTLPGFGLRATSKGTVAFIAQGRTLGRTTIGLSDAMEIEEARAQAIVLLNKTPSNAQNLKTLIPAFIHDTKDDSRYRKEQATALQGTILPMIGGSRLVNSITEQDIRQLISTLPRGSRYNYWMHIRAFLKWCKQKGAVTENVLRDAEAPEHVPPRERRLYENEVRALWLATDDQSCPYQVAYRVALLTGLRIQSEVASLRWTDFEERENGETWCNIPGVRVTGEKTKNRRAHSFYVTPTMQVCFDAMKRRNLYLGWNTPFVFASLGGALPISDRGVGNWSRKKAQLMKRMADQLTDPLEHFWIHDMRRTVGWFMADMDVRDEVIDTILGHAQGKIRRTYLTNSLDKQTKVALQHWEKRLLRIARPKQGTASNDSL